MAIATEDAGLLARSAAVHRSGRRLFRTAADHGVTAIVAAAISDGLYAVLIGGREEDLAQAGESLSTTRAAACSSAAVSGWL